MNRVIYFLIKPRPLPDNIIKYFMTVQNVVAVMMLSGIGYGAWFIGTKIDSENPMYWWTGFLSGFSAGMVYLFTCGIIEKLIKRIYKRIKSK